MTKPYLTADSFAKNCQIIKKILYFTYVPTDDAGWARIETTYLLVLFVYTNQGTNVGTYAGLAD